MADEQGYNGWKNYETWVMALWIDNDQGSYEMARELVRDEVDGLNLQTEDKHTARGRVADSLKGWIEEAMYEWEPESASVFTDLLHAAFGEVDWYEISANYLSELADV